MSDTNTGRGDILFKLQGSKELYILYSAVTKCPYIVCDAETFDDEIFLFFTEEDGRRAWEKYKEDSIPTNLVRLENKNFLLFYTSLYTMGINALLAADGGKEFRVQLESLVSRRKPEELGDGAVWVENPQMHLTALYLMQEVRRRPGQDMKKEHQAMLEETVAHFSRGRFIQPVRKEQRGIPLLQVPGGDKYQPIFTDILEFQKFNQNDQFRPLVVEAKKLPQILAPEAVGVVVNPLGVNLPLKVEKAKKPGDGGKADAQQNE